MDYKDMMDNVLEVYNQYTIVQGVVDISPINGLLGPNGKNLYYITNINDYYTIIGKGIDEDILGALHYHECDVEIDGEYSFKAVLKWEEGEYDEYNGPYSISYLYIDYIEFNFQQTFKEREREQKINDILITEFENLFF
jgi:hypothetical protein